MLYEVYTKYYPGESSLYLLIEQSSRVYKWVSQIPKGLSPHKIESRIDLDDNDVQKALELFPELFQAVPSLDFEKCKFIFNH